MKRALSVTIAFAVILHTVVSAQSPHGSATTRPQAGPNANAASGIVADPSDPAALVKTDILLQRQNETVIAASTRNPDHVLAAANDYRFVDFPQEDFVMEQGFLTRLLAKLMFRSAPSRPPVRATIGVGAWTGVYRSCDRGATHIGSAVPGSPLDSSPASLASPLKAFSNYAASIGAHAETTDPTLVAGPNGQMHLFVLGFIRKADGSVLDGRMFHVSYTDRNDREGGNCFNYDYTVQFDTSAAYVTSQFPAPFLDKPSATIDKDGTLYVAYTVFNNANNSKIVVARSTNGGISWTKTTPLLSLGFLRNHGATMTVDPLNGTVYLAWRTFYLDWPLILVAKSYDRGRTFVPGTPVHHWFPAKTIDQIVAQLKSARLQPFDQFNNAPNTPAAARALAFPTIVAGVVNGQSKLFAVWTERADVNPISPTFGQPLGSGSPRVMISASTDGGWTWTPRRAVDAGPRTENVLQPGVGPVMTRPSGPQLQPTANITGTTNAQLTVAYYEARDELLEPFATNYVSGIERQMDVRILRLNPVTLNPLAASVQVSQYALQANTPEARLAETAPGFGAVNRTNETMYGGGFKAFFGDYMTLAAAQTLEGGPSWTWTSEPASVFAIWTDHRDAKFPFDPALQKPNINGRWDLYTPVTSPAATCQNTGMRDANPYFTEIAGVIAGAPQTFKPLNIQRAFATYVANQTPVDRFFRLRILDSEGAGLNGHFKQFAATEADDTIEIRVFGNSRHNQTVWVEALPSNPAARLKITVEELDRIGGTVKPAGLRTSIVLNPDPNNDALTRVPATTPPFDTDLSDTTETHDPSVSQGRISSFKAHFPGVSSPQIDTPQIDTHPATPQIDTPQIDTPQIDTRNVGAPQIDTHLATPQIDTNGVAAPQIDTPQIDTVAPDNGTDVTYTVTNGGTTTSSYKAAFNVANVDGLINSGDYRFIVIVSKTSLAMGAQVVNGVCRPVAVPDVRVLASIPVTSTQLTQLAAIKNPQIDTATAPDIATFALTPFGGVAGQNSGLNDAYSTVLPDEVKVTLRAIRMRPLADILAAGRPVFEPTAVVLAVASKSTNVINGVVQPAGSQPVVVKRTLPELRIADYLAASPALAAGPGTGVTVPAFTVRNDGSAVNLGEGSIQIGYYLSADPQITVEDRLLATGTAPGQIAPGGAVAFAPRTVTIPSDLAPGNYYIGILADRSGAVTESNELNNYVSEPILVSATVTFAVTNTASSGPGSLRQAILDSNANPGYPAVPGRGQNVIVFPIPGQGPHVIAVQSALPALTAGVIVTAAPAGDCTGAPPTVRLDGTVGEVLNGLTINSGNGPSVSVRGLSITGFAGAGILIEGVAQGSVGGAAIECNYLGIEPNGVQAVGNGEGIRLTGSVRQVIIGGTAAAHRNVISGNRSNGITFNGRDVNGIVVMGNFVGLDASGTSIIPNGGNGVQLIDSPSNSIGGPGAAPGNVISGNAGEGIRLDGEFATSNTISGNFIGISASGFADFGNQASGIYLRRAPQNYVQDNVISGNDGFAGIAICGNLAFCGGGDDAGGSNAAGNVIRGNLIGLNATGVQPIGNTTFGISIDAAPDTVIGGPTAAERNVIAANGNNGIEIFNGATGTLVRGNYIGTDIAGGLNRGNQGSGIDIADGSSTMVGSDTSGGENVIAFNTGNGITVSAGTKNQFLQNGWFSNGGLGIDLGNDGVTANDAVDGDGGANNGQNVPIVQSAVEGVGSMAVNVTLGSAQATAYKIRFFATASCDAGGSGEGVKFTVEVLNLVTNSDGFAGGDITLPRLPPGFNYLTATATDPDGNTSEFSPCLAPVPAGAAFESRPR